MILSTDDLTPQEYLAIRNPLENSNCVQLKAGGFTTGYMDVSRNPAFVCTRHPREGGDPVGAPCRRDHLVCTLTS
jgi:hypothetical protein